MMRTYMPCLILLTVVYYTTAEDTVPVDCLENIESTGENIPSDDENYLIEHALDIQSPENDADNNVLENVRIYLNDNVEFDYCAEKGDMEKLTKEIKDMRENHHQLLIITSVLTSIALLISFCAVVIALTARQRAKYNKERSEKKNGTQPNDSRGNNTSAADHVTQDAETNSQIILFKKTHSHDKEEVL